jgi:hypothetical protein
LAGTTARPLAKNSMASPIALVAKRHVERVF